MQTFPQDPAKKNSKTIMRSVNDREGLEFTWSTWILIDDPVYREGSYRHIFHKGEGHLDDSGMSSPNNAPGLYLAPHGNTLVVVMSTFDNIGEEIKVPDIPLNKWVNVCIRVRGRRISVYVNGALAEERLLDGIPKQNYGNVYVGMNGGFGGYISSLRYYDFGLGVAQIADLASAGPNTSSVDKNIDSKDYDYLALRWYAGQHATY